MATCSPIGSSPSSQKPMHVEHRKSTASPRNAVRVPGSQSAHCRACDRAWEPPQTASGRRRAPRPRGPPRRGFRSASKLREWSQMTSASSDASEGGRPSARRRATMASRHAGTAKRRMSASTPSGTTRRPPASASSRARPVWSMCACVKKTVTHSGVHPQAEQGAHEARVVEVVRGAGVHHERLGAVAHHDGVHRGQERVVHEQLHAPDLGLVEHPVTGEAVPVKREAVLAAALAPARLARAARHVRLPRSRPILLASMNHARAAWVELARWQHRPRGRVERNVMDQNEQDKLRQEVDEVLHGQREPQAPAGFEQNDYSNIRPRHRRDVGQGRRGASRSCAASWPWSSRGAARAWASSTPTSPAPRSRA